MEKVNKNDVEEIISIVEKNLKGYTVSNLYDAGDDLIMVICKKNNPKSVVMDPYYTINKSSGQIKEFPFLKNLKILEEASKKEIYRRD